MGILRLNIDWILMVTDLPLLQVQYQMFTPGEKAIIQYLINKRRAEQQTGRDVRSVLERSFPELELFVDNLLGDEDG